MIGRHVMHSTFGHGTITAQTQNHLTVQFDGMDAEKMFRYPDAFERYLTSSDPELMAQAQADLLAQKRAHEAAAAIASAQKIRLHALKRKMQKKRPVLTLLLSAIIVTAAKHANISAFAASVRMMSCATILKARNI